MKYVAMLCLIVGLSSGCGDEAVSNPIADSTSPGADIGISTDIIGVDVQAEPAAQPPPFYLGGERPATYYMPYDYDGATPVPMIIALHGYGGTPSEYDAYFGLSKVTKESGVMLVLPQGTTNPGGTNFWNATPACCNYYGSAVDDVAYLSGLIEEAQLTFNVDPKRIYLIGFSNGGFMSYRMACERSELIAGIVNFAGAAYDDPADCGQPEPVSVLHVHGTFDLIIPYDGLLSNPGLSVADIPTVPQCLEASCSDTFQACQSDDGCKTYYDCTLSCVQRANPDPCYEACWNDATTETKLLWMPVGTCGVSKGCYGDWTIPYEGYPSAPDAVARWSKRNSCGKEPTTGTSLDLVLDIPDAETVTQRYADCPSGISTELWSITYGSHAPAWTANWSGAIIEWLLDQHKP